jgi:2'-5' RNA ligase
VADRIVVPGFSLNLDRLGYWPRPRILWCGPSQTPQPLQQLVLDLQQGLKRCGFEPERRRYKPHITLHRKVRHAEAQALEQPIEWRAEEFVLAGSQGGGPGQTRYRILHRWALN